MDDSGWADVVWLADKNWQFTVGYINEGGETEIYERRSDLRSEHNATSAMEAAYQRMQKFLSIPNKGGEADEL